MAFGDLAPDWLKFEYVSWLEREGRVNREQAD